MREARWEKGQFDDWADQFQMMFDDLGYSREDYRPHAPDGIFNAEALMGPGYVGMGSPKGFNESEIGVLARFAKEFEGTYRRFLDIQKAEARTREAHIEMSLERVRSQAMVMQKPEDISEVSIRMFDELEDLGVESMRSGISIPVDGDRYQFHSATKNESGQTTLVVGDESVDVHPIIRKAFERWKNQETFQHIDVLEGNDLEEYYHAVFDTMPLPDWKERTRRGEAATESFATFPFQDGWLYTFAQHQFSNAELAVYQRFARVFGLAYQRYNDLK
jgi:hypothetical protein